MPLSAWKKSEKVACPFCKRVTGFVAGAYVPHDVLTPQDGSTEGPCPVNQVLGLTRKTRAPSRPAAAKRARLATLRALGKKRSAS